MPNPDVVLLGHMLEAVNRIRTYVDGVTEQEFWRDTEKQDAVLRQLQVLGEAARMVSGALRDAHPEVPWHQIAGMRNNRRSSHTSLWASRWATPNMADSRLVAIIGSRH